MFAIQYAPPAARSRSRIPLELPVAHSHFGHAEGADVPTDDTRFAFVTSDGMSGSGDDAGASGGGGIGAASGGGGSEAPIAGEGGGKGPPAAFAARVVKSIIGAKTGGRAAE